MRVPTLLLALASTLAAGCSTAPDEITVRPHDVLVVAPGFATITGGGETRLTASIRHEDGTISYPPDAGWHSSNEAVARVANGGTVKGMLPGQARIAATWQGNTGEATVQVVPATGGKKPDGGPCLEPVRTTRQSRLPKRPSCAP